MAVFIIDGRLGKGKTLFLTYLAYIFHKEGSRIYANYKLLFPYENIGSVTDFTKIKNECYDDIFIAMDEGWLSADSRRSGNILNLMSSRNFLQSRKLGKKTSNVGITTQNFYNIDVRIRGVADYLCKPGNIIEDENGKPYIMTVDMLNLERPDMGFRRIPLYLMDGDCFICDLYDTREDMNAIQDGEGEFFHMLVDKYIKFDISNKNDLKLAIIGNEINGPNKVKDSLASQIAGYILLKKNGVI